MYLVLLLILPECGDPFGSSRLYDTKLFIVSKISRVKMPLEHIGWLTFNILSFRIYEQTPMAVN